MNTIEGTLKNKFSSGIGFSPVDDFETPTPEEVVGDFLRKSLNLNMQTHLSKLPCAFKQLLNSSSGAILAIVSAACYGLSYAFTKGGLEFLPPLTILLIQTVSGILFLWMIMMWQGIEIPRGWSVLKTGCVGLLDPGLSYIFIIQGLALSTANNASFIDATEPVVTIALARVMLGERINAAKLLLTLLAGGGVVLIASTEATGVSQGTLLGDLLVFVGVVFAALHAIATYSSIRLTKGLTPLQIAISQQIVALIFFIVTIIGASALQLEPINFSRMTPQSLLLAICGGILGYGIGFWLYLCALRHQSVSENSLYLTLIPIFGVIGAYLLLGERLSVLQGFGGALILMAITGISRSSPKI
jgi:drug/metabolite transporter (DMT)-like permease